MVAVVVNSTGSATVLPDYNDGFCSLVSTRYNTHHNLSRSTREGSDSLLGGFRV